MVEKFEQKNCDELIEISDEELLIFILSIPNFCNVNYVKNRLNKIILTKLLNNNKTIENEIIIYPIETN